MTFELELESFLEKAGSAHISELAGIRSGKRMGTLQSVGIFLNPDAPVHFRNARVCKIISVEEWEQRALAMYEAQHAQGAETENSNPTIQNLNLVRS